MTAQEPEGSWDQQKWPGAEPYSAGLARDFNWKPGPSNQPIGTARGIFPGRVVMSRYPEAAHWSGRWNVDEDQWFLDCNTDKDKCEEMISVTLRKLTGAHTDREAWEKIFIHHNAEIRGLLKHGYRHGETVAIKINLNNSSAVKTNNQSDATPQMTLALVRQLVHKAGVPEDCIIIYEVRRQIYAEFLSEIWQEFPDVRFVQDGPAISGQPENPRYGGTHGLEAADWVEGIEYTHDELFNEAKLMARQVKDATYVVNMAMLKLHSYPYNYMEHGDNGQTGISMSAKNHAGSIKGTPELHKWINSTQIRKLQKVEHGYNPLVDLEASPNLGRKTILYLLDGLYCGRKWSTYPLHFPNAPFYNRTEPYENPDWPACLLASLDPVALQSVGLDIMYSQSLNNTEQGYYNVPRILLRDMADDILKEMAAPSSSPSGTVYKQQGKPIPSLGVFEHWDSPSTMRYSRNLDPKNGQGIEFIYIPMGSSKNAAGPSQKGISERFAYSFTHRFADADMIRNVGSSSTVDWQTGYDLFAIEHIWRWTGKERYFDYIKRYTDKHIGPDGRVIGFVPDALDHFIPGYAYLLMYELTGDEKYARAVEEFRDGLRAYPRTGPDMFIHGKSAPHVWVDGVFMGQMFLVRYARTMGHPEDYEEVARQIRGVSQLCGRPDGLMLHAWAEPGKGYWPGEGLSPEVWSEGLGWIAVLLADIFDWMPENAPGYADIRDITVRLCHGLKACQDARTGLWCQVVDKPYEPGNWNETSGSAMFTYLLCRSVERGLIPESEFGPVIDKAYKGLLTKCVMNTDGFYNLLDCSSIGVKCSYEEYISQPREISTFAAMASFMLATGAVERWCQ